MRVANMDERQEFLGDHQKPFKNHIHEQKYHTAKNPVTAYHLSPPRQDTESR
jgi:hypothetical protein